MIVDTTYVVDTIYVVSIQISVPFCPSMLTQEGDQKMYYTTLPYWGIVMLGNCNGKRQDFRLQGRMPIILSRHIPYWWLWSTPKKLIQKIQNPHAMQLEHGAYVDERDLSLLCWKRLRLQCLVGSDMSGVTSDGCWSLKASHFGESWLWLHACMFFAKK